MAAFSPFDVILYVENALFRAVAAWVASAHSSGKDAPLHDAVAGEMAMRLAAVNEPGVSAFGASSQSGTGAARAQRAKVPAKRMFFLKPMMLMWWDNGEIW